MDTLVLTDKKKSSQLSTLCWQWIPVRGPTKKDSGEWLDSHEIPCYQEEDDDDDDDDDDLITAIMIWPLSSLFSQKKQRKKKNNQRRIYMKEVTKCYQNIHERSYRAQSEPQTRERLKELVIIF